jgi:hypothetical protein
MFMEAPLSACIFFGVNFTFVLDIKKGIYDQELIPHFKNLGRNQLTMTLRITKMTTICKCLKNHYISQFNYAQF